MSGYAKLFSSILDSTVWDTDPATTKVWVTMMAMADRDGVVEASVPGLANRAKVDRAAAEHALAVFLAPDPDSRTKDNDGRRLEAVDGGWRLLNYEKYRDRQTGDEARRKNAERQQRHRDAEKDRNALRNGKSRSSRSVTQNNPSSPSASASPDQKELSSGAVAPAFDIRAVYLTYPRREGITRAMKTLTGSGPMSIKTPGDGAAFKAAVARYAASVAGRDRSYVKLFSTFANEWREWAEAESPAPPTPPSERPQLIQGRDRFAEAMASVFDGEGDKR